MSIDYEVQKGLWADDVLQAWPESANAETDIRLLSQLTAALEAALNDATDVGVEGSEGYGTSDSDVSSVAQHSQNTYRSSFQAIVRVVELWLRLARKSPKLAVPFLRRWCDNDFRLMRRLAPFACADPVVGSDFAADTLIDLPSGELFQHSLGGNFPLNLVRSADKRTRRLGHLISAIERFIGPSSTVSIASAPLIRV